MELSRRRVLGTLAVGGVGTLARVGRAFTYLTAGASLDVDASWTDLGPAPGADSEYPPQGTTYVDGTLYVTNHWNDAASGIYRVDPETGSVQASATLPDRVTHASGLAWDGERLWAADFGSNHLYRLDREHLFDDGDVVVDSHSTGLRGTSGLTAVTVEGATYLAVSDFVWTTQEAVPLPNGTPRTYLVELSAVPDLGDESVPELAAVSFRNGGFSQGLTWDGEFLYEAVNNRSTDRVVVRDVAPVLAGESSDVERLGSFDGPANWIEDLATDGDRLWTTDEGTYRLYVSDALCRVRERATGTDGSRACATQ